jgi:hypothetical protein
MSKERVQIELEEVKFHVSNLVGRIRFPGRRLAPVPPLKSNWRPQ